MAKDNEHSIWDEFKDNPVHLKNLMDSLNYEKVGQLLDVAPELMHKNGSNVWTPFESWALQDEKMLDLMLQKGANANFLDNQGRNVLFFINRDSKVNCIEMLVKAGADLEKVNQDGMRPLFYAVERNCVGPTYRLLALGADMDAVDGALKSAAIDNEAMAVFRSIQAKREALKVWQKDFLLDPPTMRR